MLLKQKQGLFVETLVLIFTENLVHGSDSAESAKEKSKYSSDKYALNFGGALHFSKEVVQ